MKITEQLGLIQAKLKAPKSRRNTFGNYNYRSAEDILEAAKPVCRENGCTLTVSDDVVQVGDRYYIKAVAMLANDQGETLATQAFAREDESKKGMDGSQITGTASSYARKYALNGLFCIDDTKDADTDENATERANRAGKQAEQPEPVQPVTPDSPDVEIAVAKGMCQTAMKAYAQRSGKGNKEVNDAVREYIGKNYKDFTVDDWRSAAQAVEGWK